MMVPPNFLIRTSPLSNDDPKAVLRRHFRQAREAHVGGLPPGARSALETALAGIARPLVATSRTPASYAAVGPEIDPVHIEHGMGPHAFPRVSGKNLYFHIARWQDLAPGCLGIPEPPATAPLVMPDLVLVPLLAATPAGVRLGQGGGYYDRTLLALRSRGPVVAIGLAWDIQVTDSLPSDPWDEPLDYIATPTRLVDCARSR